MWQIDNIAPSTPPPARARATAAGLISIRPAQNLNEALGVPPGATPERTVTGLSLLKGGLPHFDVEVSADTPLAEALCRTFDLPGVLGADRQALRQLQQQSDSQRETTKEELESLLSPAELVAQTTAFKVVFCRNDSIEG